MVHHLNKFIFNQYYILNIVFWHIFRFLISKGTLNEKKDFKIIIMSKDWFIEYNYRIVALKDVHLIAFKQIHYTNS